MCPNDRHIHVGEGMGPTPISHEHLQRVLEQEPEQIQWSVPRVVIVHKGESGKLGLKLNTYKVTVLFGETCCRHCYSSSAFITFIILLLFRFVGNCSPVGYYYTYKSGELVSISQENPCISILDPPSIKIRTQDYIF